MKTIQITSVLLLLFIGFNSCKKIEGPQGEKGESGPEAMMKEYTLHYYSGDTYKSYNGFSGMIEIGDVIVTYVDNPNESSLDGFWVQTPFISNAGVNFYTEVTDAGIIFNNTVTVAEGASPWVNYHYFKYRSVLIKGSALIKNPNLDLSNYEKVKKTFDL